MKLYYKDRTVAQLCLSVLINAKKEENHVKKITFTVIGYTDASL